MASDIKPSKISIITTSYTLDRFKDITQLLDSIQAQNYEDIETLVVTERSPQLAESIKAYINEKNYPNIKVIYNQGEWGSYPSRNLGVKQATGEIIAFVDDDALLLPGWAEATAKAYTADNSIIGITGPILPLWKNETMTWFPREFFWIFSCTYLDWDERKEVRNGYCTNLSFRREAFDLCGFFKTSLAGKGGKSDWQQPGGEETEFCLRVKQKTGRRIIYDPDVKIKHKVYSYRLSTKFIAKRAYWEGYAKATLNKLYRDRNRQVLAMEHELLRRIFIKLIPSSLKLLPSQPTNALRQLYITLLVLLCVSVGYCLYNIRNLT